MASLQLTAMHVDSHQHVVLKKLVKSIINIKHQSILASFPENKLQKIISKKKMSRPLGELTLACHQMLSYKAKLSI